MEKVIWASFPQLILVYFLRNFPEVALIGEFSDVHIMISNLDVVLPELQNINWISEVIDHVGTE